MSMDQELRSDLNKIALRLHMLGWNNENFSSDSFKIISARITLILHLIVV